MIALVCLDPFHAGLVATFALALCLVIEVVAGVLAWAVGE